MSETNRFAELLVEDEAHHLASRGVLRVRGDGGRAALQSLLTNEIPEGARGATYAVAVDAGGKVFGDLFVIPDDGDLLVDCDRAQASLWLGLIEASAAGRAEATDESDRWRVFGLLNNQALFDDGTPYIRYADPRRHELGSRVLRPSETRESLSWRHEGKWRGHTYRLGVPGVEVFSCAKVDVFEAELHALSALHPARLAAFGLATLKDGPRVATRRVLPFRVEPSGPGVPAMAGEPVIAEGTAVGDIVAIQGLYGLALVELAPWRAALARGARLECAGEQVLVAWPTWLGTEAQGPASPAARGM